MIKIIVAHDFNRIIGKNNSIPWHLPKDLKHFKSLTEYGIIVMGRNTYESILAFNGGKPLPNRKHVVLSNSLTPKGVTFIYDAQKDIIFTRTLEIIDKLSRYRDIWIIGGADVYKQYIDFADEIHVTLVNGEFEGDTKFPEIPVEQYVIVDQEVDEADEDNKHYITYVTYERIGYSDTKTKEDKAQNGKIGRYRRA